MRKLTFKITPRVLHTEFKKEENAIFVESIALSVKNKKSVKLNLIFSPVSLGTFLQALFSAKGMRKIARQNSFHLVKKLTNFTPSMMEAEGGEGLLHFTSPVPPEEENKGSLR